MYHFKWGSFLGFPSLWKDIDIVRDSGFLDLLEPFDKVMADREFRIKTDLAIKQCSLSKLPSAAKGT